ncbi:MAG: hypothetical protein DRP88_05230, partial [Candidatus Neomarinimicrobiota bacterium]
MKRIWAVLVVLSMFFACSNELNDSFTTPAIEREIDRLLSQMTLEEKVGQMTQVDIRYIKKPEDVI